MIHFAHMKNLTSGSALFALMFTASDLYQPKNITFPNPKAKASVLVFLSAKCPCSASHEPILKDLASKYAKDGIEFIAVHANQNEALEVTRSHFVRADVGAGSSAATVASVPASLGFPMVEDRGAKIANELKALKTPHAYIIQNGKVVYEGGVDDSADAAEAEKHYLADALVEIKNNKPVTTAKTRSLGCVIKR
jgi:hypothetical protein